MVYENNESMNLFKLEYSILYMLCNFDNHQTDVSQLGGWLFPELFMLFIGNSKCILLESRDLYQL